jgi:release factor glutamine methyltransferase
VPVSAGSTQAYGPVVSRLRAAGCVWAEEEARLLLEASPTADALGELVGRRASGEPLELVLGWAEFCGLRIRVEPGVFVPRVRTECLAGQAVALLRPAAVAVDLCCGTGAIGAALAEAVSGLELHAADLDPAAVSCARANLGAGAEVHVGDLYDALPRRLAGRVDVLAVNVPYVPTGEVALLPAEARVHEPRSALDGGRDGLDVMRRVANGAPRWLAPAGHVLVETSAAQAPAAAAAFARAGLDPRVERCDELDATVVIATPEAAR